MMGVYASRKTIHVWGSYLDTYPLCVEHPGVRDPGFSFLETMGVSCSPTALGRVYASGKQVLLQPSSLMLPDLADLCDCLTLFGRPFHFHFHRKQTPLFVGGLSC